MHVYLISPAVMDGYTSYDLTEASYDDFVQFLFAHEVIPFPKEKREPGPWYWHATVEFRPLSVASFYIRLFTEPDSLLQKYSLQELEQGFWAIQSSNIECSITEIIWMKSIPFEIRESCVRAMFHLYQRLFSHEPLDTSVEMWWDSLAYDWHCENRSRSNGGEDLLMQDVMFETLSKILALPSSAVQASALHGLGHLHHPDTKVLVDEFLQRNPQIDPGLREYALAAAKFDVM